MIKKYKHLLGILFLFFLSSSICFARKLEVELPGLSGEINLLNYRNFIFAFLTGLGGALAVLAFVFGAIRYMTSAGNSEVMGEAKKRMISAVLGLIVMLSSYLIIQKINPNLTSPLVSSLTGGYGVFLTDGGEKNKDGTYKNVGPCPTNVADTSTLSQNLNKILYKCEKDKDGKYIEPILKIWIRKFKKTNLEDWSSHTVEEMSCGGDVISWTDSKSFLIDLKIPGLYLYNGNCTDEKASRSLQKLGSEAQMESNYLRKTNSFKIINDTVEKIYYGAIFYSEIGFKGTCSDVFTITEEEGCKTVPSNSSSFNFFQYNNGPDYQSSGDGVTFYSRPFGWQVGANAGYKDIPFGEISPRKVISNPQAGLTFFYDNSIPKDEQNLCKTFKDCPGSIRIKGNYLVTLYADGYCESFFNDATNLKTSWVLNKENGRTLNKIVIVALK